MRHHAIKCIIPLGTVLLLGACGPTTEDMAELRSQQKQILAKLNDLEKKIDSRLAARPAGRRPQVDPNKVYNIPAGNSPFKGAEDAKVVITEFSDFQCPFCARATPLLDQMVKEYPQDVKLVFKQFPLTSIHPLAMGAAKASLAAAKQGKFWEMHDELFANSRALQPDKLKEYAEKLGLDVAKFEADMKLPEIDQQVRNEMKQAASAQVTGTPTIFVNGKRLMNRSPDGFRAMIDAALKEKQSG
jgi:protein-disulfide isomerase